MTTKILSKSHSQKKMNLIDIEPVPHRAGWQRKITFPNTWGVSVIPENIVGRFEAAIFRKGKILSDAVCTNLELWEVEHLLDIIQEYAADAECQQITISRPWPDPAPYEPITVEKLIAFLQTQPPKMRVVKDGYEGGLSDLRLPGEQISIRLNVNKDWYYIGAHEEAREGEDGDEIALRLP